jgi:hypothetical protein
LDNDIAKEFEDEAKRMFLNNVANQGAPYEWTQKI